LAIPERGAILWFVQHVSLWIQQQLNTSSNLQAWS
jgi:hypothetical protein